MEMRSAVLLLAIVSLILGACTQPRSRSTSDRTLAACEEVAVDTGGWRRHPGPYPGYTFLLPPGFARDTSTLFRHGGRAWRHGAREIHIASGYWSEASFRGNYGGELPPDYSECWDEVAGLRVFLSTRVSPGAYEASGYFPDPRPAQGGWRGMEIVLGGNGPDREDQAMLLTVIRSVRRE